MKLKKVEIEGYRSIRKRIEVFFDSGVTVVLGPNDHGKTNFLEAVLHLNSNKPFDKDFDLNWDCAEHGDTFPCIKYFLTLNDSDKADLKSIMTRAARARAAAEARVEETKKLDGFLEQQNAATGGLEQIALRLQSEKTILDNLSATAAASPDNADALTELSNAKKAYRISENEQAKAEKDRISLQGKLDRQALVQLSAVAADLECQGASEDGDDEEDNLDRWQRKVTSDHTLLDAKYKEARTLSSEISKELEALKPGGDTAAIAQAENKLASSQKRENLAARKFANSKGLMNLGVRVKEFTAGEYYKKYKLAIPAIDDADIPDLVVVDRTGVNGKLRIDIPNYPDVGDVQGFLMQMVPRVELIEPIDHLPDSASPKKIHLDEQSFMRGIFYYADLPKEDWAKLFDQTHITVRTLKTASEVLDKKLKESWTQGKKLDFELRHNSGAGEIELMLSDPAVKNQMVRASRRSRGFTHFFALRTILHAKEKEFSTQRKKNRQQVPIFGYLTNRGCTCTLPVSTI